MLNWVRFKVPTATIMKMAVSWDVEPCSLVDIVIRVMMEAVNSSKTSVNMYQTTRCYNPEESS
jgi:hypothetical protein